MIAFWTFLPALLIPCAASARADQIVTPDGNFTQARILRCADGRVEFQDPDGTLRSAWIDEIELIVADRGHALADFNEAERYLSKDEPHKAAVRYRRAATTASGLWADLIPLRMLLAEDRAGKIDEAAATFIRLVDARPDLTGLARLVPQSIPDRRDGKTHRALNSLDAALHRNPDPAQRALLSLFRFEILRRTGDDDAPFHAAKVARLPIPAPIQTDRVYAILLHAVALALEHAVKPELLEALNRAILHAPEPRVGDFLLLKGRVLFKRAGTRRERIRAAWPFLRVVAHLPDDPRAAEALYEAAQVLARIDQQGKAVRLLEECLDHPRVAEDIRQAARTMRERLRDESAGAG